MRNLIRLYRDPAIVDPAAPPVTDPAAAAAAPVDLKPGSAATTLDLNTPPVKSAASSFVIPDAFKDKPYLKGVDSPEKLFAMLDGAQTLIGQKGPAVPKVDAPQADWDKYYESIGRPKTAAEYQFDGAEKADQKFLPKVQSALHKAGLTPSQAKTVWSEVNVALGDYMKEKGIADAQQDIDFEKLATDTFQTERDKVLARSKDLIYANISPSMKPAYEKLDNNSLIVLADVLRNIDRKYISPDGIPPGGPTATGSTPDELRAKARGFMEQQGKLNPMSQEFIALQKQIDDCYETLRRGTR